mgnify:CR=1 FL=1
MSLNWYMCHVYGAGSTYGNTVTIGLKENGGKFEQWFSADTAQQRELLATGLAALSTGYEVSVGLEDTVPMPPPNGAPLKHMVLCNWDAAK